MVIIKEHNYTSNLLGKGLRTKKTKSQYCRIPISTINQDVKAMGEMAVDILLKLIAGSEIDKKYHVIPVELIRRKTT